MNIDYVSGVCFHVNGRQNLKYPQFEPHMADGAIAQGGIQGLGSPLYICGRIGTLLYCYYIKVSYYQIDSEVFYSLQH